MTVKSYFITAIDTDIGKTFLLENICKKIDNVNAIKPIITGYQKNTESDLTKILDALNIEKTYTNIANICPWRFKIAASPHIAADNEINFNEVIEFCKKNIIKAQNQNKYLFIEGAGGVNSPINNDKTFADLINELNLPAILITSNFLGSISQTICAINSLKLYNIKIQAVILNNHNRNKSDSLILDQDFIDYIMNYCQIPTIKIEDFLKNPLDLLQKKVNT